MGDDEADDIRAGKLLDWERHLRRVKGHSSGVMIAKQSDRQIDIAKAYGLGTFLKDVTGLPGVPARPENGPIVLGGNLYRDRGVYTPVGVTDLDPLPSLFWGTTLSVVVAETAGGATDYAIVIPANTQRFAKTAAVKGSPANTSVIYVRGDGVAITAGPPITGFPIGPGDIQVFPVKDLQNIHYYSPAAGQDLHILYVPDANHA